MKAKITKIAISDKLERELYNDGKDVSVKTPSGDVLNVYVKGGTIHVDLQASNEHFWQDRINELTHQLSTMEPK